MCGLTPHMYLVSISRSTCYVLIRRSKYDRVYQHQWIPKFLIAIILMASVIGPWSLVCDVIRQKYKLGWFDWLLLLLIAYAFKSHWVYQGTIEGSKLRNFRAFIVPTYPMNRNHVLRPDFRILQMIFFLSY